MVAEGHTGPLWWDGVDETLPGGIDAAIEQIFAASGPASPRTPSARWPRRARARVAPVASPCRLLKAMRVIAERHGLTHLVAPVRPSLKERYPLTDIERYVRWRREDGQLFDPWMRSTNDSAREWRPHFPVNADHRDCAEWETWTGTAFPESGRLRLPRGSGHRAHRSVSGPRLVLGAKRLDGAPGHYVLN